jgi:hypothetical protein
VKPTHLREQTLTEDPGPPGSGVVKRVGSPATENFTYS